MALKFGTQSAFWRRWARCRYAFPLAAAAVARATADLRRLLCAAAFLPHILVSSSGTSVPFRLPGRCGIAFLVLGSFVVLINGLGRHHRAAVHIICCVSIRMI